jgi:hypothetical protein
VTAFTTIGFLRHRKHEDAFEHDLRDRVIAVAALAALVLRVDHHVDVGAGQREAGHADDVVDAHRHCALAFGHHRRQAALGADRREPAFGERLAALERDQHDAALELGGVGERAGGHTAVGPVGHADHLGRDAPAQFDVGIGHRDAAFFTALVLHPARREEHRREPRDGGNEQHQHAT